MEEGITINHARNGGEVKVAEMKVDGYCQDIEECWEFFERFYHGCLKCFSRKTVNPKLKRTMQDLYDDTMNKLERLKDAGLKVQYIWEHDWDALVVSRSDV